MSRLTEADLVLAAKRQPGAVERHGGLIKFQCPACRGEGHDRSRDNACLFPGGAYGCAFAPKDKTHTRAIGEALGVYAGSTNGIAISGVHPASSAPVPMVEYIETAAEFIAGDDPPQLYLLPDLLPAGVLMLLHGEPRARKSLAAFELALMAAAGRAPFGMARFCPTDPVPTLYVQEEDPRALTRARMRALINARLLLPPDGLYVAVRRGVNLDDPQWVAQLIADVLRLGIRLLVLDAARRLSAKTDEGPQKVRELVASLRTIVTTTGVSIVIVHHDTKPPATGEDLRRRSQRASGGDWFAACECPIHVERLSNRESLVFPQDYKFGEDPVPFTFTTVVEDGQIVDLVGSVQDPDQAEHAGRRGRLLAWIAAHPMNTKSAMKTANLGQTDALQADLDALLKEGKIDASPGRQKGSFLYFVTKTKP